MPPPPRQPTSRPRSRYLGAADRFSHGDDRNAAVLLVASDGQAARALAEDADALLRRLGGGLGLRVADAHSRAGEHAVSTQTDALREASVARLLVLPVTLDERAATSMLKRVNAELRRWRLLPELRVARLDGTSTDLDSVGECLTRAAAGWLAEPAATPADLDARARRALALGAAR